MVLDAWVDSKTITGWMAETAALMKAECEHLTELDTAIGDGDHGVNMCRGFCAVSTALASQDPYVLPGSLLILAGRTVFATVGGASGQLWGVAFRCTSQCLGSARSFRGAHFLTCLDAGIAGIVQHGMARPGDKTMVDALQSAAATWRSSLAGGDSLGRALALAAAAAERGARATKPMLARRGRASYLGERSIGHQDPGATSAALVVRALERCVTHPERVAKP